MKAEKETLGLIGDHFRRARLAAGLTQEQVADLAGISRPRYRDEAEEDRPAFSPQPESDDDSRPYH